MEGVCTKCGIYASAASTDLLIRMGWRCGPSGLVCPPCFTQMGVLTGSDVIRRARSITDSAAQTRALTKEMFASARALRAR